MKLIFVLVGLVLPPTPPQITSITPLSNSLSIYWEISEVAVDIFRIEVTYLGPCNDDGTRAVNVINGNVLQHTVSNLRSNSTYSVIVTAVNSAGGSSGNEHQVTTLSAGNKYIICLHCYC